MSLRPFFIDCKYKQTSSGSLYLRIYPSDIHTHDLPTKRGPWSLLFHGGGFSHGAHTSPFWWHLEALLAKGISVISVSYRFAPHVSYRDIVQDCLDAHQWCKDSLSITLLQHDRRPVDPDRFMLMGESAGATLALTLGLLVHPRPKCVVDCYGLVDFTEPPPFPITPLPVNTTIATEAEILKNIKEPVEAHAVSWCPGDIFRLSDAEVRSIHCTPESAFKADPRARLQFELFKYLFSRHLMIPTLFRQSALTSSEAYRAVLKRNSVISLVDQQYPPTFILHGTSDTAVKITQSRRLAEKLRALGVDVTETYIEGADHCMDSVWTSADHPEYRRYALPIVDSVEKLLS